MRNGITSIVSASRTVLQEQSYLAVFLVLVPLISFLLFLIPVQLIPGNDVRFQASLFHARDYLLLAMLALLESLLLVMYIFLLRRSQQSRKRDLERESLGVISGIPAFLFGTKACPMCVAAFLGFLGPNVVFTVVEYRQWIFGLSAIVLLLSLYVVSRKIEGNCEKCLL